MKELGIDIETYSSNDLLTGGVYRYVEAADFQILLFSYSIDGGEVRCVDLASGESLPEEVLHALTDENVIKTAFNAVFERTCISKWLGRDKPLEPKQWRCTMVRAARMGLPLSLAQCGEVLGLAEGKMKEGRALIRLFSVPNKKKAKDGSVSYVQVKPTDEPEKWGVFKQYNIRDVEVEQAILKKVRRLEAAPFDEELYVADQHINDRGVLVDLQMVKNAARFDMLYKAQLLEEAKEFTKMDNPNSPSQIKEYIAKRTGFEMGTLNKKSLDDYRERFQYWADVLRLLQIREELGKTSNKKYEAILNCVCKDGRVHGLLQFYGAARTGRWAGRLVQLQNLPQNHIEDIDVARQLVKAGDMEDFMCNYLNPTQTLSELIRTAFIAPEGHIFHVCDFSAIEARVIAWIAGEEWVLAAFRHGHDIYCETASKMFGVIVQKHGQNGHLRQKGKVAVLGLGYGGGVAALEAMGGKKMGLTEDEEKDIVYKWRESNPNIVRLWARVEKAAMAAIQTGRSITINQGITFNYKWGMLLVTLPSGRTMCYPRAKVETVTSKWGKEHEEITYEGLNQTTKKWGKMTTYGGKLTENIVQATARDILGYVILRAERQGLKVVFHIHDEIIVEAEEGQTLEQVEELFSTPIRWCMDLPLKGAGYSTPYYLKD